MCLPFGTRDSSWIMGYHCPTHVYAMSRHVMSWVVLARRILMAMVLYWMTRVIIFNAGLSLYISIIIDCVAVSVSVEESSSPSFVLSFFRSLGRSLLFSCSLVLLLSCSPPDASEIQCERHIPLQSCPTHSRVISFELPCCVIDLLDGHNNQDEKRISGSAWAVTPISDFKSSRRIVETGEISRIGRIGWKS